MVSVSEKTLLTAYLVDGFWDRWIAHGGDRNDIFSVRPSLTSVSNWLESWHRLAREREEKAEKLFCQQRYGEAEFNLRAASLYYNLAQWIYPLRCEEKEHWYRKCQKTARRADEVSPYKTEYVRIAVEDGIYEGRLRFPKQPIGCVILVNPLDSNKEEMFTYENDFLAGNFITVCVDGPGQGATYLYSGLGSTLERWYRFVEGLVKYACRQIPDLPLFLFGTSSGATWSIFGTKYENIQKAVAVSPAVMAEGMELPIYFEERMQSISEDKLPPLPVPESVPAKPILLFHGKKDVMVKTELVYRLYRSLPAAKLIEYEEEGHCCNFKLEEVRRMAMEWFIEKQEGDC